MSSTSLGARAIEFFDLPLEIRQHIYRYIFEGSSVELHADRGDLTGNVRDWQLAAPIVRWHAELGFLLVSKEALNSALPIFYEACEMRMDLSDVRYAVNFQTFQVFRNIQKFYIKHFIPSSFRELSTIFTPRKITIEFPYWIIGMNDEPVFDNENQFALLHNPDHTKEPLRLLPRTKEYRWFWIRDGRSQRFPEAEIIFRFTYKNISSYQEHGRLRRARKWDCFYSVSTDTLWGQFSMSYFPADSAEMFDRVIRWISEAM